MDTDPVPFILSGQVNTAARATAPKVQADWPEADRPV